MLVTLDQETGVGAGSGQVTFPDSPRCGRRVGSSRRCFSGKIALSSGPFGRGERDLVVRRVERLQRQLTISFVSGDSATWRGVGNTRMPPFRPSGRWADWLGANDRYSLVQVSGGTLTLLHLAIRRRAVIHSCRRRGGGARRMQQRSLSTPCDAGDMVCAPFYDGSGAAALGGGQGDRRRSQDTRTSDVFWAILRDGLIGGDWSQRVGADQLGPHGTPPSANRVYVSTRSR